MFDKNICRVNIFLNIKVFDYQKGKYCFLTSPEPSLQLLAAAVLWGMKCFYSPDDSALLCKHPTLPTKVPTPESLLAKWLVWHALSL